MPAPAQTVACTSAGNSNILHNRPDVAGALTLQSTGGDLIRMQLRIVFAFAIYLGSYLPLSVILLAQDVDGAVIRQGFCSLDTMVQLGCISPLKNPVWSLSAVGLCAAGLIATVAALRTLPATVRVEVVESKHIPSDLINYVIPYVVSFMSLDYEQAPKLFGFAVFLLWILWITYKTGQIAMNPVLAVLGWKLYEIKYKFPAGHEIHVGRMLSKVSVVPGRSYRQNGLQDVMVAKGFEE